MVLGILFLLSLPAIFYLLLPGFYEPHDLHHLADIYQMVRAILSGQIPPRLGPDFSFGFGYPLFNFYYLLPFYLGAVIFFILGSLTLAFKGVFIVSVLVSILGMYLFLKEFFGKWPAIVGSILFLYTPYRAVQIYVRGAMGEALVLALFPLVLWGLTRVVKSSQKLNLILTSLILALFYLSHNYFFLIVAPFVIIFVLTLLYFEKNRKTAFLRLSITVLLSVGLTAFWWLPALWEYQLVSSITPFNTIDHFPFIKQLISSPWGYGSSVWGPGDEISFQIGTINLVVVLISIPFLIYKRNLLNKKPFYTLSVLAFGGFLASIFMMNIRSYFIWQILPFANFIQFPWRFLTLTTFFSSVLAAFVTYVIPKRKKVFAGVSIVFFSIVLNFNYFRPSKIVHKSDQIYLERFFANKNYSEDYLLLPEWVKERPLEKPSVKIESEEAKISEIEQVSLVSWKAKVESEKAVIVKFNNYYFPGWFAKVNNQEVKIVPGDPFGQIEIEVPGGKNEVYFFWRETGLRKFANVVSMVSAFFIMILWYKKSKNIEN